MLNPKSAKTGRNFRLVLPLLLYLLPKEILACSSKATRHDLGGPSPSINMTWLFQNTEFSRNNVGVVFNPFILTRGLPSHNASESKDAYTQLIQQVTSKFTKLFIPMIGQRDDEDSRPNEIEQDAMLSVPKIVAKMNRDKKGSSGKPVELLIEIGEVAQDPVAYASFEANVIFPGTVKNLIYCPTNLAPEYAKILYNRLKWEIISNITESFGFGLRISMEKCKSRKSFQKIMNGGFKNLFSASHHEILTRLGNNIIYVSSDIPLAYSNMAVEKAVSLSVAMYQNCKGNIQDYFRSWNKSFDVAFSTQWFTRGNVGFQELVQFVQFWEQMNEWADKTNTTIIFSSAFDTNRGNVLGDRKEMYGWWSLFENETFPSYQNNWVMEDKKQAAARYYANIDFTNNPAQLSESSDLPLLTISAALSIFLIILVLSIGFYFQRTRKTKYDVNELMEEFLNGGDSNLLGGNSKNLNRPYNKAGIELPKKSFKIDESTCLGTGEVGKIYRGVLKKDEKVLEVAVKTIKDLRSYTALRSLLYEIKILAYLGKHPHVVELLGAYTAKLMKCQAFVFLEFCPLGSLQYHLRTCKPMMTSTKGDEDLESKNYFEVAKLDQSLSTDMFRWSSEIADGMEFLASKHIVHLDIAARNVLLTAEKTAKITDFGLSRRMYDYQTYAKTHQEPLPWRWMSPEALRRCEFTEKSDVWSFGILLWEIYSLGDEPYPGLSYDVNFPTKLERGLKPGEPKYNRNSMYSVMLRCWTINPEARPTFSTLARTLWKTRGFSASDSATVDYSLSVPKMQLGPPSLTDDSDYDWNAPEALMSRNFFTNTNEDNITRTDNKLHQQGIRKNMRSFLREFGYMWPAFGLTLLVLLLLILFSALIQQNKQANGDLIEPNTTSVTDLDPLLPPYGENRSIIKIKMEKSLGQKVFLLIELQNEEAVKDLVILGANLNETNIQEETPLLIAAASYNKTFAWEMTKFLVENGADISGNLYGSDNIFHRLVAEGTDGLVLSPQQFDDIAKFFISKNQSRLFNIPGDFSKEFQTPGNWYNGATPVQMAVKNLDIKISTLSLLHENGVNFNAEDKQGESVLFYAMMGNKSGLVLSELIKFRANWKHLNNDNSSLLHITAAFGNLDQLKFFLNLGLDVNAVNFNGDTPLHMAGYWLPVGRQTLLKMQFLLEHGANMTIKNKLIQTQKDLTELGKYRNLEDVIDAMDEKVLEICVEAGADVNAKNNISQPLLHKAALSKNKTFALRIIKLLIENKADVFSKDMKGYTFLHKFVSGESLPTPNQFQELTSYLVSKNYTELFSMPAGASLVSPFLSAIYHFDVNKATLELLHRNWVNFNQNDRDGNFLLSYALMGKRSLNVLSELVRLGVDLRLRNVHAQSLLHVAAEFSNLDGMRLFLNLGLDVNAKAYEDRQETPLYHALDRNKGDNFFEMVKLLVERGANNIVKYGEGGTALDVAMKLSEDVVAKYKIIKLLQDSKGGM